MEKRKAKRWTEEECLRLKALYLEGLILKDIATEMSRSYSNIVWKISHLGLKRGKELPKSGTGGRIIHVAQGHIIHRSR
jgi:hypothetical protein